MIDPTNIATFPFLSGVAKNFEKYEFEGLVYTYKPTSGSAIASTNNALGTVILTTEYDVSRPLFVSKPEMEAYQFTTSCAPDKTMYHPVECNPKMDILNSRYVAGTIRTQRTSTLLNGPATTVQNNLQFLGRTQLAVVGMQAATTVGELWVSYKVKLTIPRLPGPSNYQGLLHARNVTAVPIGAGTTGYGASYNISSDSTSSLSSMDITLNGSETRLNTTGFLVGTKFLVGLGIDGQGSGLITQPNITANGGITESGFYFTQADGAQGSLPKNAGATKVYASSGFTITDQAIPSYIGIPAPTITTNAAIWDLQVHVIPPDALITPFVLTAAEKEDGLYKQIMQMQARLDQFESEDESDFEFEESKSQPASASSTPTLLHPTKNMRRLLHHVSVHTDAQ